MEVVVTKITKGILLLFDLCNLETQGAADIELLIRVGISVQQECYIMMNAVICFITCMEILGWG